MQAVLLESDTLHATAVRSLWAAVSGISALPSCFVDVCIGAAALLRACSRWGTEQIKKVSYRMKGVLPDCQHSAFDLACMF